MVRTPDKGKSVLVIIWTERSGLIDDNFAESLILHSYGSPCLLCRHMWLHKMSDELPTNIAHPKYQGPILPNQTGTPVRKVIVIVTAILFPPPFPLSSFPADHLIIHPAFHSTDCNFSSLSNLQPDKPTQHKEAYISPYNPRSKHFTGYAKDKIEAWDPKQSKKPASQQATETKDVLDLK